jgi:hypothetical protein
VPRKKLKPGDAIPKHIPPVSAVGAGKKAGNHLRTAQRRALKKRFALISLEDIKRDTFAYKKFSALISDITHDLGGRPTTIQKALIEAFVSAVVRMEDLTSRQLLGDRSLNYKELSSAINNMAKMASHLGIDRSPKDVTPSLSTYLKKNGAGDTIDAETIDD